MDNSIYEVIIGLEIHIQSKTNSKMFCSCDAKYFEKEPNTFVCPVCLGLPGALPVPNKKAIQNCIKLGLATNCEINNQIKFDRKHYFYPDLPKGYQISQYDRPLCFNGNYEFISEGTLCNVEIERIHQEEDVAKSFHYTDSSGKKYSAIDYNKSGVALIELVTKPVIKSAKQAKDFATSIRQLVRWLNISDADMEKGQMRCEPNISVQKKGSYSIVDGKVVPVNNAKLNPKVEVKNIGSISAIEKAINYEVNRMIEELESGKILTQQTRGWNAESNVTVFQRSKESAPDYKYFPDPDIPLIEIDKSVLSSIKSEITVLPIQLYKDLVSNYSLSSYDAGILSSEISAFELFSNTMTLLTKDIDTKVAAKEISNWISGTLFALCNELNLEFKDLSIKPSELALVILKVNKGEIISSRAKELIQKCIKESLDIEKTLNEEKPLLNDDNEIKEIIKTVLTNNTKAVEDLNSGKDSAIMFLVGQVMRETKGRINPNKAKELILELIKSAN